MVATIAVSLSRRVATWCLAVAICSLEWLSAGEAAVSYQREVEPFLRKYCVGCHHAEDAEADFACDSLAGLLKGSKDKVVIEAKAAEESLLVKLLRGTAEPKMPPEDEVQPTDDEIAMVMRWIDQGALGPERQLGLRERLESMVSSGGSGLSLKPQTPQQASPITAMQLLPGGSQAILGRYGQLTLVDLETQAELQTWDGVVGKVTSLRRTTDPNKLVVASGVSGLGGQVSILNLATMSLEQQWEGHTDILYAAVMSPDQRWLATAGYDRTILVWDLAEGKVVRSLAGHNGAVYDLDFHPSGELLASCSADETTKIWRLADGKRMDTLSQGEAEQYSVRFSADGQRILAVGADRRIRMWRLLSRDREAINPMLAAVFAHEKPILWLRQSPDAKYLLTAGEDRILKLWDSTNLQALGELGRLSDLPSEADWDLSRQRVWVASLDGKLQAFEVAELLEAARRARQEVKSQPRMEPTMAAAWEGSLADEDRHPSSLMPVEEAEPNNGVTTAGSLTLPAAIHGRLTMAGDDRRSPAVDLRQDSAVVEGVRRSMQASVDEDWYGFEAKAGERWVLTAMADEASPLDPRLEIRDGSGQAVLRTRLQAVRETYFTFRGKDSNISNDFRLHRWEDMEINELLYSGGEVVKLWLYPRGPDSGFTVYPGVGSRDTYFDTTPISHALGEPAWIVRELGPEETPLPNGLPVFPIYYENDDDATRTLKKNSRLLFRVPKDGRYYVRVRDSRGLQGDDFAYTLSLRPQQPDFRLKSSTQALTLSPGSGVEFSVSAERLDDFKGSVRLELEGVPEGIVVSQPLEIQAEQLTAIGTFYLPEDLAEVPSSFEVKVRGIAIIEGQRQVRRLAKSFSVKTSRQSLLQTRVVARDAVASPEITELVIRPGQTISTFIAVERGEEQDDLPYGKEDSGRNLPHGIFVDNIGLSGLVIKPGQSTREVFITAAPWVQPQQRPFHLRSTLKGNPTTRPILLRVLPVED